MNYVSFEDFGDALFPHLLGANPEAVRSTFLLRAQDFYRGCRAWRELLGGFVIPNDGNLQVWLNPVDGNADIAYVERVWWANADEPQTLGHNGGQAPLWRVTNGHDLHVSTGANDNPGNRLIWAEVSCIPTSRRPDFVLPPVALTHHRDTLVSGVLAVMFGSPKKPYTDLNAAALHERRFVSGIAKWRGTQDRGYTPGSLRASPRPVVRLR
jgi:hypothetical protein